MPGFNRKNFRDLLVLAGPMKQRHRLQVRPLVPCVHYLQPSHHGAGSKSSPISQVRKQKLRIMNGKFVTMSRLLIKFHAHLLSAWSFWSILKDYKGKWHGQGSGVGMHRAKSPDGLSGLLQACQWVSSAPAVPKPPFSATCSPASDEVEWYLCSKAEWRSPRTSDLLVLHEEREITF